MSNGNGHRWSKFWWQDWRQEMALRLCSLGARGLWMEMLCLMHEEDGYLLVNGLPVSDRDLAAITSCKFSECRRLLAELEENKVFSRTENGVIFCRRMVRDVATEKGWKEVGRLGGNPTVKRGTVPKEARARKFKRSDAPQKTARIFAKTNGKCFWCEGILQSDIPGPDFFQIDHVIAVRDGGTNDESNLVPACTICNLKRSKSDHNRVVAVGYNSDLNQHGIPTATLEAEAEAEADPVREESSDISKPEASQGTLRAREEPRPNGLDQALRDAGVPMPKPGNAWINPNEPKDCAEEVLPPDQVGAGATMAQIRRVARAHRNLAIPQEVKRSPTMQIEAMEAPQPVAECDGYRWAPAAPVRTPAQQLAEILGIPLAEAEQRFPAEART